MATVAQPVVESRPSPELAALPTQPDAPPQWSAATLIAFPVCFIYFGIYVLTTQMLPGILALPGMELPDPGLWLPVRSVDLWVGRHVLGITRTISYVVTGSGDKTFDWVHAFTLLLVAAIGGTVWSVVSRRRTHHARLFAWFRLFIRIALATTMFGYGMAKVVPLQMPVLSLSRLVEPYGNFSPMGVLWSSIGSSPSYEIFVGSAEVFGGLLLLWPRTATLGALVCLMDTIEVFTLNMTYDVPVKLFSFHLILMSLFLIALNARRLFDLFFLKRRSQLRGEPPLGATEKAQRKIVVAQVVFGVYVLGVLIYGSATAWKQYGGGAAKSPLYGIWEIEQMTVDGQVRPALLTDTTRWRRAIIQRPTALSFQGMNDKLTGYAAVIDTTAKTLTLTAFDSAKTKSSLSYARPTRNRLLIDGTMKGHPIHMELAFRDPDSFLQRSRGFTWISESPFNR